MSQNDYYQILGVDQKANAKQIKNAYRKLAFQYHPDRNDKNPAAAEKMKSVNEAYAVLSNADKRREYDTLQQQVDAAVTFQSVSVLARGLMAAMFLAGIGDESQR